MEINLFGAPGNILEALLSKEICEIFQVLYRFDRIIVDIQAKLSISYDPTFTSKKPGRYGRLSPQVARLLDIKSGFVSSVIVSIPF